MVVPSGDDADAISEGDSQHIHPGVLAHILIELPDGVGHLILHTCRAVCAPLHNSLWHQVHRRGLERIKQSLLTVTDLRSTCMRSRRMR